MSYWQAYRFDAESLIISTYAGNDTAGFGGDGGPATAASLNSPLGLATDDAGNLYIADNLNGAVRLVSPAATKVPVIPNAAVASLKLYPNPAAGACTINMSSGWDEEAVITITNAAGEQVKAFTIITNKDAELHLDQPCGLYFISAIAAHGSCAAKMIIGQ